jgi:S-DNA-T family DNA segregation ATPase FtsK/SpoIIIE
MNASAEKSEMMRTTSYRLMDWLPEYLMGVVRRRLLELCGLAVVLLAALAVIALATWSAADPSMSHAADRPVHNFLGRPGAAFADFMLQMSGAASPSYCRWRSGAGG